MDASMAQAESDVRTVLRVAAAGAGRARQDRRRQRRQPVHQPQLATVPLRVLTHGHGRTSSGRLLRQAAEPRRLPSSPRLGRVRQRLGPVAAGGHGGHPCGAGRPVARGLPDEPRLAFRLCGGGVRSAARPRRDGAKRRSCRPLLPDDHRRRPSRGHERLRGVRGRALLRGRGAVDHQDARGRHGRLRRVRRARRGVGGLLRGGG